MPVAERWAYFDHAAVAPLPAPVHAAVARWLDEAARDGDVHWTRWRQQVEQARRLAARLIGAAESEIALIHNTTEGVNLVAEGFPWRQGDNVVLPAGEFPTNLYPWLNLASRGVQTRIVPTDNERLDLDRLDEACDARTRIVAASWVGYATGWRNDVAGLADVAHRRGALLFLDAIQGLGVFPLDVSQVPVDFLAADGHKWLLGPEGAGVLYVRRQHLDLLRPLGVGWNSVQHAGEYTNPQLVLKPAAGRYEGGSYNMAGIAGLAAALEFLGEFGPEAISRRLLEVTDAVCRRLEDFGAVIASCREGARRSGIVAFQVPGRDSLEIKRRCLERGIAFTCRAGRIRLSPHAYANDEDIERLMAALRDVTR